ncbi:DUF2683 domain-containing protein [Candidatus Pacearchaeota archaeon]|nr:DUF2683 domain-containing protein [Candidatus Pacearchaeota archaeon]
MIKMVKAIVDINDEANRVINIVKAKEDLKDKSDALNLILTIYGREILEPELRPEFIKELLAAQKEKTIKVKDFSSRYK